MDPKGTRHLIEVRRNERAGPIPDGRPFDIPAVAQLLAAPWQVPPGVTILVGENGSGKSTVVEALAGCTGVPGR